MEYDLKFAQKIKCSNDEKRECLKLVSHLLALAKKARAYGMLSLAIDAEETSSFLLRKGIQLATDGAKPRVVRSVMEFYIVSGKYSGKDLLERCIILEGVLAIQDGIHPRLLRELLLSFFGEEDHQLFNNELNDTSTNDLTAYLKKIADTQADSPTATKLSNFVLKLNEEAIEELLKEMNTSDLANVIGDMSGEAMTKIFNNMPHKGALALKETLEQMEPISKAEISEAQEQFVNTISELKKKGRI